MLERCVFANFNAIRVWGGGYYPDDYFFDICDELGLIVFFDLAFACTYIMPDKRMLENIVCEVRQNLERRWDSDAMHSRTAPERSGSVTSAGRL